ncbi:transferase [Pseudonocardia sp. EC080625-04]|uniref:gamma-glutamyltransferase family protein n=1 Tax=unclassified Pseudonocardia TaxID=2619320 RepID=UPI0006CB30F6|nr:MULTISPECIES: gamma-glutamyltransferase [unclassified Pseudonocardia]ALE73807.1 transferase [Pseudonocardia sp. EC080625-04]ALL80115.1 transferase [Pseudonocardia sp. EC080619-01]
MTAMQARPDLVGSFGMAASTHWLASATAQSVLERGGNSVDAATAAGFVLHVVEPHLNGPGGDLVGLVKPAGGEPSVVCGQGPAPAAASIGHLRAEGLDAVPGAGALAAAVPGAVDAWLLMLARFGTWPLGDVLDYAIGYAERGVPLLPTTAAVIGAVSDLFRDRWPSSARLWLPDGRVPVAGEVLANPTYAATLRRIRDEAVHGAGSGADRARVIEHARRVWGGGFVANAVEKFVATTAHRHSSGSSHHGVLTGADMAGFRAHLEEPVGVTFRGHRVYKAGPWSQGPALLQALSVLDGVGDARLDPDTAEGVHLVAETLKLALADRDAWYGHATPRHELATLLSPEYAAARRAQVAEVASHEFRPGHLPGARRPWLPPLRRAGSEASGASVTTGEPTVRDDGETRGDTCHVDVVDRWGAVVSVTPSGGWLQSSPAIPELGFCLGTRLQMTWLDAASPAALGPGRRPRTTLSPTLVRHGYRWTALGTPGGDQQEQWQLGFLLRTVVGGSSPQHAVEAPAVHTTGYVSSFWPRAWEPGGLSVEDRLGDTVVDELVARGHVVTRAGDWALGRLSAAWHDRRSGLVGAAANPRGAQGYAVGR